MPTTTKATKYVPGFAAGSMSNNYATDSSPVISTGLTKVRSIVITAVSTTGVARTPIVLTTLPTTTSGDIEIELIDESGAVISTGTIVVSYIAYGEQ